MRIDRDRLQNAAVVADEAVRSGSHAGAVMAVANSEETLWTHVVSGEDHVELDTIFLLASITKPITATAVMQLVEQGKLLLNSPAASYLPEFGANGKERVNTWHLLTHTSGMNEQKWAAARFAQQGAIGTDFEEACAAFLNFAPGARCEYNTLSFAVMAELIAQLGGQSYTDYLRDWLFLPLSMRDTSFRPEERGRAAPVHGFGGAEPLEQLMARAIAGGGLWSTAADMIAFGQAFLNDGKRGDFRLLAPATVEVMTRHHTEDKVQMIEGRPEPFHYGLGWGKPTRNEGNLGSARAFAHGGATGTLLWIDPEWDLVFVFLTNKWGQEQETPRRALNAVYGALYHEL